MRRLRKRGIPFRAVNLTPIFGSIDAYTEIIADAVADAERATGRPPVIVGHSMGGLAARAWLASSRNADGFYRIVTIASPHRGTALARRSRFENGRQMAPGSAWLAGLAQRETAATRRRFVCFWSHCDNIVFPTRTATLVDADNRHLEATPHVQMIYHPQVFAEVVRLVDAVDVDVDVDIDGAAFELDGSIAQSALVSASTPRRT